MATWKVFCVGLQTLVDSEVPLASHLAVIFIFKGEVGRAVGIVHSNATSRLIDVALHDVTIQTTIHQHRTLDIDLVANLQQSKVGAVERLLHGCNGVRRLRAEV